jgi:hypothetical protein
MTNELEYYGRPEPYGRTFERTRQPEPIQLPPGEKVAFYKLFEGDAMRLAKVRGLRAGASFLALAVHAGRTSSNGSTCFPKVTTAAELTGQSTRATSGHFRGLGDDGFIQARRRRRTSSVYTVAHSDSSKQRYAQISKPWLEAHRGAGASALFLLAVLLAMAGPRRTFPRRLTDLLAALDVSRATFYRLAGELKRRGWLDWDCADGLITLTMLENPVSETTVLPVSKTAVLAVSKTAHEVDKNLEVARGSEEARSTPKSKPTPDQRSAENRARAAAVTSLSPFQVQDQNQAATKASAQMREPSGSGRAKLGKALVPLLADEAKKRQREAGERGKEGGRGKQKPLPKKLGKGKHEGEAVEQAATHENCDCIEGWLYVTDAKGHTRVKPCGRLAAWLEWQAQQEPEQIAPLASVTSVPPFDFFRDMLPSLNSTRRQLSAGDTFDDVFGPSPHVRTIEGELAEPKQLADSLPSLCCGRNPGGRGGHVGFVSPAPLRDAGEVLPPKMLADCRKWIAVNADVMWERLDTETRKRVDGMLREGGVARYGAEALRVELVEARRDQWMTRHGHCHGREPCDGTCGHDQDECDGRVINVSDKGVLDLVGCAIYALTGDERFGRHDSGAPNAVYERMCAA